MTRRQPAPSRSLLVRMETRMVNLVRPLREIYAAGRLNAVSTALAVSYHSANRIEALRFAAFAARPAERRSAEETAPRSPSRRDEAIAPRGRLVRGHNHALRGSMVRIVLFLRPSKVEACDVARGREEERKNSIRAF